LVYLYILLFPYPAVTTSVRCLKFSVFPWLSLNTTDRHILSSNERYLYPLLGVILPLLLSDIYFPAEIFLQRPSTVQSLLSLLGLNVDGDVSYLTFQALACLEQLCRNLRSRLHSISQNSSISYPQEVRATQRSGVSSPEESSPRPSVVGRTGQRVCGDGQDGDAASSSGSSSQRGAPPGQPNSLPSRSPHLELPPEMEAEDSLELPLKSSFLRKFFQRVLELLAESQGLLGNSIAPEVWGGHSLTATELKQKLQACIKTLGDVICYHHGMTSSEQLESSLIHHQMVFRGTAIFIICLLQTLLFVEKVSEHMAVPFLDINKLSYPLIHESVPEQACFERYSLYCSVSHVSHCMEATCTFLKDAQAEVMIGNSQDRITCRISARSICFFWWKFAQASPILQSESQKIFLKLLSHPLSQVKAETYSCSLSILKCSGVQNVAKPASSICSGLHFLLHSHVLYEISMFGLQDQAREVNYSSSCFQRDPK
uniref:Uncharacterized protein n=1 Tax=Cyprinus carpio carpio TaxID=630221 RepID=A0A9J8BK37_CYPCA